MTHKFDTLAVHAGAQADRETGAVAPPIHLSTTFVHAETETPGAFTYQRVDNPTQRRLETALAVLEVIEKENLIQNADEVGFYISRTLNRLPKVKEIRGRGLMIGIELDFPIAEIKNNLLQKHHIFVGNAKTNIIRLLPPLTLHKGFADKFINALEEEILNHK